MASTSDGPAGWWDAHPSWGSPSAAGSGGSSVAPSGSPTVVVSPWGCCRESEVPPSRSSSTRVRELDASARLGAQVTFFRLGEDPGLARFVDSMARRAGGRVVAPELGDLGAAVVGSYLDGRTPGQAAFGSYRDLFGGRGFWVG